MKRPQSPPPQMQGMEDALRLVSHDLQGALRGIRIVPQWIEEDLKDAFGTVPENVQSHIDLLGRQSARLDRMILDLIDYAKIGTRGAPEWLDVSAILKDTPDAEALTEIDLPRGLEINMCRVDLQSLLSCLCRNILVHGGGRGGLRAALDGDSANLHIFDSGPGIAPEHHERIFELMRTLRPRDEIEGSGMGLPIAAKIAEFYGGQIDVKSARGEGATFTIALPRALLRTR